MRQHADVTPERWSAFGIDRQILMIANEMNRAGKLTRSDDAQRRRHAYERTLRLTDLTIEVNARRGLRRELLRWRDLVAALYISDDPDGRHHKAAIEALLLFTPDAAKQRPFLLEERTSPRADGRPPSPEKARIP